jgi:large subunit ribosomal protein L1
MKDMKIEELVANARTIIDRVVLRLDRGLHNIGSIYVKTTMGPAIPIEVR